WHPTRPVPARVAAAPRCVAAGHQAHVGAGVATRNATARVVEGGRLARNRAESHQAEHGREQKLSHGVHLFLKSAANAAAHGADRTPSARPPSRETSKLVQPKVKTTV